LVKEKQQFLTFAILKVKDIQNIMKPQTWPVSVFKKAPYPPGAAGKKLTGTACPNQG